MCLAIFQPDGIEISEDTLYFAMLDNPDGAGFAVSDGSRLIVQKGFMRYTAFIRAWRLFRDIGPALIHFRYATHGARSQRLCHPFRFDNGQSAMVHNGILPLKNWKGESDTSTFVLQWLASDKRAGEMIHHPAYVKAIGKWAGKGNKLAFISANGRVSIANEESGAWLSGAWYSNLNSCPAPRSLRELDEIERAYDARESRTWAMNTESIYSQRRDESPCWDCGAISTNREAIRYGICEHCGASV